MFNISNKPSWLWLLPVLLTGCQTVATIKLPPAAAAAIKTVRIAALEAPPLEVLPDLLDNRMPNVAHDANMALPVMAEEALYLNPGGILTAGKVGYGDSVETAGQGAQWTPTQELSAAIQAQLTGVGIDNRLDPQLARLPLAADKRNANVGNWRAAVENWYAQNASSTQAADADAVLEVGIGQYRVFEDQTSLQVMIKLIDSRSGQVLAKSAQKVRLYDASAPALLYPDGSKFKALVREHGARLASAALQDIGLVPLRLSSMTSQP